MAAKEVIEKLDYLFSKINFGESFLDAKAIEIMNNIRTDIEDLEKVPQEIQRILRDHHNVIIVGPGNPLPVGMEHKLSDTPLKSTLSPEVMDKLNIESRIIERDTSMLSLIKKLDDVDGAQTYESKKRKRLKYRKGSKEM